MPNGQSFGRCVAQQLNCLGTTLNDLCEQMLDAIARAVAVAAADAVRAVTCVLLGGNENRTPTLPRSRSLAPRSQVWDGYDEHRRRDSLDVFNDGEDDDLFDYEPPVTPDEPSRARHALALGCKGAAWWLTRGIGKHFVVSALAVGVVCTAAACLVGNYQATSILNLVALGSTLARSARLCGGVGMS
jgi:hypothetical protein